MLQNLEQKRVETLNETVKQLESSLQTASVVVDDLNKKLRKTYFLFGWGIALFICFALIVIYFAVRIEMRSARNELIAISVQTIEQKHRISQQNETIEQLRLMGGNAQLGGCKNYTTGKTHACVQVYGGTRSNGEYAMLYDENNIKEENLR